MLIPRKILFGNPEKAAVRVSPDGTQLAYLAPLDGVLNVWVGPVLDISAAHPVTNDTHRGVRSFFWAYTNAHILYLQDKDGDEGWHVYSVNLENQKTKDLTPINMISARIQEVSYKFPTEILVGINDRGERQLHDVYRVNIVNGERQIVQENPGFAAFMTDDDYRVRFAITLTQDGGHLYLKPDAENGWKEFRRISPIDSMTTHPVAFDKSGKNYYMLDSLDRDKTALKVVTMETQREEVVAESDLADIDSLMIHPTEKTVQAVTCTHARQKVKVLDQAIQPDLDYLKTVADGDLNVTSRTLDDKFWTLAFLMDNGPGRFYLYDRQAKSAKFLFTTQPELEDLPLVKMHSETIKVRDDLELVGYISLPASSDPERLGRPSSPQPMVLLVHGGPWARDEWGYIPNHQWLTNRGYAVLSVNYRGSTGFGKKFINKGDREWAAAMHDDLIDSVNWAIEEKIADRNRVAIMGGSYGGYATLVGLTFTPDVFRCGVDIVGPSNLVTMMENPPPYWVPLMPLMKNRVGDCTDEQDREFLKSRSPLTFVDRIQRPLLIAQGKHDPRVKQSESDQIVTAMNEKGIPVTYLLFTEEGHGFAKPENQQAFSAVTEAFLARHLGGEYESIGDAFEGATFNVPSGKDGVPGLEDALKPFGS